MRSLVVRSSVNPGTRPSRLRVEYCRQLAAPTKGCPFFSNFCELIGIQDGETSRLSRMAAPRSHPRIFRARPSRSPTCRRLAKVYLFFSCAVRKSSCWRSNGPPGPRSRYWLLAWFWRFWHASRARGLVSPRDPNPRLVYPHHVSPKDDPM